MGFERRKIGLGKLRISTENPRFKETKDQKEAIAIMLAKRGDEIYNMARDLLEVGRNPTTEISVYANPDGTYKVKDGNRRVTAVKLMMDPSLVPKADKLNKNRYIQLNKKIDRAKYKYIDCIVFDNEDEADLWVERNHSGFQGGIGQIQWDSIQKKRFASKRKKTDPTMQIFDFVTAKRNIEMRDDFPITTLERILGFKVFREALGYRIEEGNVIVERDIEQFIDEVAEVINDLSGNSGKKYTVRDFIDQDKASVYISEKRKEGMFRPYEISEDFDISKAEKPPEPVPKAPPKALPSRLPTSKRTTLIPKDVDLDIHPEKINDIYHELQELNIRKRTNCGSVMLRVFLDLSIDYYLTENGDHVSDKGKTFSEIRTSKDFHLDAKIRVILKDLKGLKKIDNNIDRAVLGLLDDDDLKLAIELNQYVHNYHFNPKPDNIKLIWNNLEGFIKAMLS
ncbi:MAG: hypothetical protein EOM93_05535 [Gammaproteobacteria bacterium]|nr:hypothetical protein [Gammaproteobacteria bacterium]